MPTAKPVENLKGRLELTEAALQRCEKLAVASRYAGAIMHEVNNPLAAIANLVYLTHLQADDPAQVRDNMKVVEGQLVTLSNLTAKVLAFHREQSFAKEFDLIDITESALKLHGSRLRSGKVTLTRNFRKPAMAHVFGSEILQVISNLLLNALDALPEEDARLRISIRKDRDVIKIAISDNGCGISPQVRKKLFTPHVTTKETGTGFGLWLSMRIIEKHRGTIRVRSSQVAGKQGSTFRLTLPVKIAA